MWVWSDDTSDDKPAKLVNMAQMRATYIEREMPTGGPPTYAVYAEAITGIRHRLASQLGFTEAQTRLTELYSELRTGERR